VPGRAVAGNAASISSSARLSSDRWNALSWALQWLRVLAETGPSREAALARLHELLVRIARAEVRRRGPRVRIDGPELDDLACQAAADALMTITRKLGQFRGESRFHDLGV